MVVSLAREASCHLRPFRYTYWRDLRGTPSLDLGFAFNVKCEVKGNGCTYKLPREASSCLRSFCNARRRNFGTISVTPSFDLEFDL